MGFIFVINIYNNMKNSFLLVLLLLVGGAVSAQSVVYELYDELSDTSIVRRWMDDKYIIYSHPRGSVSGELIYCDVSVGHATKTLIPSGTKINDMRIANDTLYACGWYGTGMTKKGIIACLDINDLKNGGGVFHVIQFQQFDLSNAKVCNTDLLADILEVRRIELFKSGVQTRVAYIANDTIYDSDLYPGCRRVGYGDVAFDNLSGWDIGHFRYNKDGKNLYWNMVATDNYLAAVSVECEYRRIEIAVYYKGADFVNVYPPITWWPLYYFTDHEVVGKVMTTAIRSDMFGMAYHYRVPGMGVGMAVKVFQIVGCVPSLVYSIELPPIVANSGGCEMRDVVYNQIDNVLWILTDMESPVTSVWNSYIYRIDMGSVYAGIYDARFLPDYQLYSLDNCLGTGYIVSGKTLYDRLIVSRESHSWDFLGCYNYEIVRGVATTPVIEDYGHHHCYFLPPFISIDMPYRTTEIEMDVPCIYIYKKGE